MPTLKYLPALPALDGLRAFAVLLVLFHHANVPGFIGGGMGVDIFFVLSGFLITTLLLEECQQTGNIKILPFYLRRALRLYPALLLMLALVAVLAHMLNIDFAKEALFAGTYLADFAIAFGYMPPAGLVSHTWSLAIEEQFYLVWPPLLLLLRRFVPDKNLVPGFFGAFLLAAGWKCWCMYAGPGAQAGMEQSYYRFDTRLDGLLLGAALAALRLRGGKVAGLEAGLIVSGLAFLFCVVTVPSFGMKVYESVAAEVFGFFLLAKILAQPNDPLARLLSLPAPVFFGRISYGIYLFHYPIATVLEAAHLSWPLVLLLTFGLSTGLAWFSWNTVEKLGRVTARKFRRPENRAEAEPVTGRP